LRDVIAVTALVIAAMLEPWGTAVSIGLIIAAVVLTGRVRLTSPPVLAVALGVTLALISSEPRGNDQFGAPLIALAICFIVHVIDGMFARLQLRKLLRPSGSPAPPVAGSPSTASANDQLSSGTFKRSEDIARYTMHMDHQHEGSRKESKVLYEGNRFIGAGDPLRTETLTVAVEKPLEDRIKFFRASDLLDYISDHIQSQGEARQHTQGLAYSPISGNGAGDKDAWTASDLTYGIPALIVDQVIAVPAAGIKKLPLLPVLMRDIDRYTHSFGDQAGSTADGSPSAYPARHYVRAVTTAWDGQLVVSLYVSAALQGHYLRMIMRPYIITPIAQDLQMADIVADMSRPALFAQSLIETTHRFLDIATAIHNMGRRDKAGDDEQLDPPRIMSPRERYSQVYATNMHHVEDADRIIQVMELKIFEVTETFLKNQGVDTKDYEQQVQILIQNSVIAGHDISLNNSSIKAGPSVPKNSGGPGETKADGK
jgi:hypothetical protein